MKYFLNRDELLKTKYKFNTPKIDWLNFTIKDKLTRTQQKEETERLVKLINQKFGLAFESQNDRGTEYDDIQNIMRIKSAHNARIVQLKGACFTLMYGRAIEFSKELFILLNEEEQKRTQKENREISRWKVGRIDIAIDLLGYENIFDVIPIPSETYKILLDKEHGHKYFKGFKAGKVVPYENEKRPGTFTGWKLYTSKRELTVYTKNIENKLAKNKLKSSAYDLLFKTDETIFRVELKEKAPDGCLRATEAYQKLILNGEDFEEEELSKRIFRQFYENHRMYKYEYYYKGKNKLYYEEERWKNLFQGEIEQKILDYVEFKEKTPLETFIKYYKTAFKAQIYGEISEEEIKQEMAKIEAEIIKEKNRLEHFDGTKPKSEGPK